MRTLKAIIFDMDGTLADTEEFHRQAFNAAFTEFGLPFHWGREEYKNLLSISGGRERIKKFLHTFYLRTARSGPVSGLAIRIHDRKSEIYREMLVNGHVVLRPGVERLIREADVNGVQIAIATSSSTKNVETLLKVALGDSALQLFKSIVTCDIIEEKKPSPAVYSRVLRDLDLSPEFCIAIEDTHNGNLAALSAGIATVITTHMFTIDDDFAGSSLVLDCLGEPEDPATALYGDAFDAEYVNTDLLDRILTSNTRQSAFTRERAIAAE